MPKYIGEHLSEYLVAASPALPGRGFRGHHRNFVWRVRQHRPITNATRFRPQNKLERLYTFGQKPPKHNQLLVQLVEDLEEGTPTLVLVVHHRPQPHEGQDLDRAGEEACGAAADCLLHGLDLLVCLGGHSFGADRARFVRVRATLGRFLGQPVAAACRSKNFGRSSGPTLSARSPQCKHKNSGLKPQSSNRPPNSVASGPNSATAGPDFNL